MTKATKYFIALISLGLLLVCPYARAQDIIFKTSGEELKAKVVEITPTLIRFSKPDAPADSIFTIPRGEVFMVKFANGAKELMQPAQDQEAAEKPTYTSTQMFQMGQRDARMYYKGTNAMLGSVGATLLLGIPGTVLIAAIPPRVNPKEVPDAALLSNQYYYNGYRKQAHKRKVGKAALGGGIAFLTVIALVASVASAQ